MWQCKGCRKWYQMSSRDLPNFLSPKTLQSETFCEGCHEIILNFKKELVSFNGSFEN